ncbi:aminotransferase class V-fold PLP-dependent enzyme [Cellulomonas sp. ATA003]|uniref:aminotransferase class V-fold PLP-dependent enzyme n=1 Tax=Cellulomonas sp. ATA003 TaxID=3073064 RepID=UPI0028732AFE|nr:aminotransferase class V-fold PLP-dependent enzyme [Cellulomonas sp. ATA003]WNB87180.1 aminotransferase class V-fold PLP-dependent enzyme [Cellulomonas sp. ATA003]
MPTTTPIPRGPAPLAPSAPAPTAHRRLVGDDVRVPVAGGGTRRYVDLDTAATSSAAPAVVAAVTDLLPWYSSVHRGAGAKSQVTSARYEAARDVVGRFVGADPATHQVVFPRNTTEALNLLAFRLRLEPDDVVLTTAAEHHANLLPWRRHAQVRTVDVDTRGTFTVDDVVAGLGASPRPRVLALTGASNVTGWMPDLARITAAARHRGVLVVVDAAQLAPHRPIDMAALGVDVLALSGHKLYAPFGAGALVAPRALFRDGEPFLVGGGAVSAVSGDDVVWADGPQREEAGSPNVLGAVALAAAATDVLDQGWDAVLAHEVALVSDLDRELASVPRLRRYGATGTAARLPVAAFNLEGTPHALLATRLSVEFGIGVRSGCFCAHPYMGRLLGLTHDEVARFHADVRAGRRDRVPGAVRASANRGTARQDVAALGEALREIAATPERDRLYRPTAEGWVRPTG